MLTAAETRPTTTSRHFPIKRSRSPTGNASGASQQHRRRRVHIPADIQILAKATIDAQQNIIGGKKEVRKPKAARFRSKLKRRVSSADDSDKVRPRSAESAPVLKTDIFLDPQGRIPKGSMFWNEGPDFPKWNHTEVFRNFLILGAGRDGNSRCLLQHPNDPPPLIAEKSDFYYQNNVRFILNMAGSPMQKEMHGMLYPVAQGFFPVPPRLIPMDDIDTMDDEMAKCLDDGAKFIQFAFLENRKFRMAAMADKKASPPKVYVHCVAGVHRSPMVVVWWMVTYHNFDFAEAWDLVRLRRDKSCVVDAAKQTTWTDITVGGSFYSGIKRKWYTFLEQYLLTRRKHGTVRFPGTENVKREIEKDHER